MNKQSKILRNILRIVMSFVAFGLTIVLWVPLWLVSWVVNKMTPAYMKYKVICVVGKTGAGKSLFKTYFEDRMKSLSGKKIWSNTNQANYEWVKDTPFECIFDNGQPRVD